MSMPELSIRIAIGVMLALCSSWSVAQTCGAGIRASNPTIIYVIDGANGTVTDSRTGLMWDRCSLGESGPACNQSAAITFSWQAALDAAATVGTYKGYNDWRLPNVKELHSLVEECRGNPSINESVFPTAPAFVFWTGSPFAGGASFAWFVEFTGGVVGFALRTSAYRVRLVRAGQ